MQRTGFLVSRRKGGGGGPATRQMRFFDEEREALEFIRDNMYIEYQSCQETKRYYTGAVWVLKEDDCLPMQSGTVRKKIEGL